MKIAIICAYPPSKGTLTEYNYHLVHHFLQKKETSEIYLITDQLSGNQDYVLPESEKKVKVFDCWQFNSYLNAPKIISTIWKLKPDIVLFNIQFLTFGDKKIPAALGLTLPMILRVMGNKTVVLLHNIVEQVDLSNAGITSNKLLSKAFNVVGTLLTKCLLQANLVTLTISKYVEILEKKYNKTNIALTPHGSFEIPPTPNFDDGDKPWRVMTFGKFGTYKKVEVLIDSVVLLREKLQKPIEIVIAGTDNPNCIGYLENVKKEYAHILDLHFTGYVEEQDVPTIFHQSTLVVFPYTSTTGSSGILHQAGSYGKAVVLPNIGDLSKLVEEEGYTGAFFEPENTLSLANAMEKVLVDSNYRRSIAEKNYLASASLPMADIVNWYIMHFERILGHKNELYRNDKLAKLEVAMT